MTFTVVQFKNFHPLLTENKINILNNEELFAMTGDVTKEGFSFVLPIGTTFLDGFVSGNMLGDVKIVTN